MVQILYIRDKILDTDAHGKTRIRKKEIRVRSPC